MPNWGELNRIWLMCQSCARAFGPPRAAYLLFGTCAQESLLDLRAKYWLRSQERTEVSELIPLISHDTRCDIPRVLRVARSMTDPRGDALSCLFAWLHCLGNPGAIPEGSA